MNTASPQLVGHEDVRNQLLRAISESRLSGGILLSGPDGIGKSLVARELAQGAFCSKKVGFYPCETCADCRKVAQKQHESLLWIESEGLTIKLESVKQIVSFVSLKKMRAHTVVVIEDAQKINIQAANAFLKTLEEPPEGVLFILTAPQTSSLISTIRSRVKNYRLQPLSDRDVQKLHPNAPLWAIRSARGSLSRLEGYLQPEAQTQRHEMLNLLSHFMKSDSLPAEGEIFYGDAQLSLKVLEFWVQLLRDYRLVSLGGDDLIHPEYVSQLSGLNWTNEKWERLVAAFTQARYDIEGHVDKNLVWTNIQRLIQAH